MQPRPSGISDLPERDGEPNSVLSLRQITLLGAFSHP